MERSPYRMCLWIFTFSAFVLPVSIQGAQTKANSTSAGKSTENTTVIITGRLLFEDKSPAVGMIVIVGKVSPQDAKTGDIHIAVDFRENRKPVNPNATTRKDGRFVIAADRRFWKQTGRITVAASPSLEKIHELGLLKGADAKNIVIEVDPKQTKVELGDIIIKR